MLNNQKDIFTADKSEKDSIDSFVYLKSHGTLTEKQIHILEDMLWLHDVEIGTGGNKVLKMDIVLPNNKSSEPLPVIVHIHGGGWCEGCKDDHITKLVQLAKAGYISASIEYRLTHEAIFPSQLEDCKLAIRYLKGNAMLYNIDVNRIGVWGNSAGGHLAALLGTTNGMLEFEGTGGWQEYSSEVNSVVDWSGPVDFTNDFANNYICVTKLLGAKAFDDRKKALSAMPASYLSDRTPPFLILHGDEDEIVPFSQSISLYNYLKENGIDVTFIPLHGVSHVFNLTEPVERIIDFFNNVFLLP